MADSARSHAVVVGGSIAGLAAARVLADHYDRVTLIERDRLPTSPDFRKGTPQAHHLHGLLLRGRELMEELFPGLTAGLLAEGAVQVEFGRDLVWHHFGGWKAPVPRGVVAITMSRPLLESEVRKRTLAYPRVHLLDGGDVSQLATDAERKRVTGVVLRRAGAEADETLEADLVVDATGRGSRTPAWLEKIGRKRVEESIVKIDVGYSTRQFQRPPEGTHPWKAMFIVGQPPGNVRHGVMWPIEGGRWMVSLAGMLGDYPPGDEKSWMEFARNLTVRDLYDVLKDAPPTSSEVAVYRFPSHQRRRYERMGDFPDGLAVLGDAHCSFSPVYGQGMTTAVMGSVLLGSELARWRRDKGGAPGFSRAFQAALARSSDEPWQASTGEDFRLPGVAGDRPFGHAVLNWYTGKMHRAATTDPEVALRFYRVMHMVSPLSSLLAPSMILRVLRGGQPAAVRSTPTAPARST